MEETKSDSSQHDTSEAAGDLKFSEEEKTTSEVNIAHPEGSQDNVIPSDDETWRTTCIVRGILEDLLTHVPPDATEYKPSADSIVRGILSDMMVQVVPSKTKSGESVVRGIISEVLSRMSNEINVHRVSLDCEFLKEHLGAPLSLGLCEVVIKRPVDPIHYLAHWLFKWRWNQQQKKAKEEEIKELTVERDRKLAELKEKERLEAEQRAELERIRQANEAAADTLDIVLNRAFEMISQAGEQEGEGEMEIPPDIE